MKVSITFRKWESSTKSNHPLWFDYFSTADVDMNHNQFIDQSNLKSQVSLDEKAIWTWQNLMKLNTEKSKFMVVNFTEIHQFNTRLNIENNNLKQTRKHQLLGVVVKDQLNWHSNTEFIIKKAYKRVIILHNLLPSSGQAPAPALLA